MLRFHLRAADSKQNFLLCTHGLRHSSDEDHVYLYTDVVLTEGHHRPDHVAAAS